MTFNEAEVRRDTDGKFDTKTGTAPAVALTGPQNVADLPRNEPFEMYPGRETDLDNGGIIGWMEEHGVKGTAFYRGERYDNNGKGPLQHRYSVFLKNGDKELETPFFTGTGWTTAPSAGDVIDNLVMDAQLYESEGRKGYQELMVDGGMSESAADYEYTKFAHSVRQFRDFVGDDYGRLVHGEDNE